MREPPALVLRDGVESTEEVLRCLAQCDVPVRARKPRERCPCGCGEWLPYGHVYYSEACRRRGEPLCACGCGRQAAGQRKYAIYACSRRGPQEERNACACGCGRLAWGDRKYATRQCLQRGQQAGRDTARPRPRKPLRLCLCGCGELTERLTATRQCRTRLTVWKDELEECLTWLRELPAKDRRPTLELAEERLAGGRGAPLKTTLGRVLQIAKKLGPSGSEFFRMLSRHLED